MLVRADRDGAEKFGNICAAGGTAPENIAEAAAAAVGAREFAVRFAVGFALGFSSELKGEFAAAFELPLVGEVPALEPVVALPAGTNPCNNV